jgi:hypothetical protein
MTQSPDDQCYVLAVPTPAGATVPVSVRTTAPLTDAEVDMLGNIAQAAIAYDQRVNPHGPVIQELMLASRAAIRLIPDNPFFDQTKDRLRAATNAARDALRMAPTRTTR